MPVEYESSISFIFLWIYFHPNRMFEKKGLDSNLIGFFVFFFHPNKKLLSDGVLIKLTK